VEIPLPQILINLFQFNQELIHLQLKDISHADSLLQPPFQANCMNWVVGHILTARDEDLHLLGLPGLLSEAEEKTYGYGSEPITCPDGASDLGYMLQKLDESLEKIVAAIPNADLAREVEIWRGKVTLAEGLLFSIWHETYHGGQLEPLRQLAGKNDKVV